MDSNTSMPRSISFKTLASKDKRETQDKLDYQELINNFWETTGNVCIRFTIDDIDRHVKSGRAERWKKKYLAANDYLRYVTELYSRFPHE
jgi:fatty acid-binding protein DegV